MQRVCGHRGMVYPTKQSLEGSDTEKGKGRVEGRWKGANRKTGQYPEVLCWILIFSPRAIE